MREKDVSTEKNMEDGLLDRVCFGTTTTRRRGRYFCPELTEIDCRARTAFFNVKRAHIGSTASIRVAVDSRYKSVVNVNDDGDIVGVGEGKER